MTDRGGGGGDQKWFLELPRPMADSQKNSTYQYVYSGTKAQIRNSNRDKRLGNEDKDWVIETKIRLA